MHLADVLVPGGRHQTRSATLVRRHASRRRRPRVRWVALIAAALVSASVILLLVGQLPLPTPMVGLLGGNRAGMVTGPVDDGPTALLARSQPSAARIVLDGRERGRTPLQLHTTPGSHTLLLDSDTTLPAIQPVNLATHAATVDVALWTRHPATTRLRPAYPGAQLVDAASAGMWPAPARW